jgi:predicted AlkP superfamily pyrophosphatase or phosphodiesterase
MVAKAIAAAVGLLFGLFSSASAGLPQSAQKPKLVVVISYDQFRGDYPARFADVWGPKGFRRLASEGAYAPHCLYNHASNMTGPGHATLLTGVYPAKSGIVSNEFYDRTEQRTLNCVEDSSTRTFGVAAANGGISPRNLVAPTIGDLLREKTPASRVIGISMKDRGGVLMAGHKANLVAWFEPGVRGFTTSAFYADTLPAWLTNWNARGIISSAAGKVWRQALPDDKYTMSDSLGWEGKFPGGGRTFPYTLPASDTSAAFGYGFLLSPFAIEAEFDLARTAIEAEQLGGHNTTDLLCISVSTTDYVGHLFGPDSREVQDIYYHADRILGDFVDYLDGRIGREHYVLVVCADHGVAPVPEMLLADTRRAKIDAGRVRGIELLEGVDRKLEQAFPTKHSVKWIEAFEPPSLFLNDRAVAASGVARDIIIDSLCVFVRQHTGIGPVIASRDLAANRIPANFDPALFALIRNDYYPDRTGDVMLYPREYWIWGSTPATHGMPYEYDRSVPLYFFGGGIHIPAERLARPTAPADIAPTLARLLDLPLRNTDGVSLLP